MALSTTQLAYLVGLPPNEVPAVEIARGDLVEVTPASYGVMTRAFHFWSGEGRGDETGSNLYENFAEATSGKGSVLPESGINFSSDVQNMETEAAAEEAKDKEMKAGLVKDALQRRLGSLDGTRSAPTGADGVKALQQGMEGMMSEEGEGDGEGEGDEEVIGEGEADDVEKVSKDRSSQWFDWRQPGRR